MNPRNNSEDPVDLLLRQTLDNGVPEDVQRRLQGHLVHFRNRVDARDYSFRPKWHTSRLILRMAAGACIAIVTALGILAFLASDASPTWADVVERFAEVPFFNVTIYYKSSIGADPVQLELWMAQGGRMRLHAGNEVIFGLQGREIEKVRVDKRSARTENVEGARMMIQQFVENLGSADTFSFDTFMRAMPRNGVFSPPLANENLGISKDLVVFDITDPNANNWFRVWALRESRLPVRVLFWNPDNGESFDATLSYADEQAPEFFDPEALKEALNNASPDTVGRPYLLMRDPGGRPVTSEDIKEKKQTATQPNAS